MRINTKYIKKLKPCCDRLNNWNEHYYNFEGTLKQFLNLENITHNDKIWIFFRSISKEDIALIAGEFAEQVLFVYEKYNPDSNVLKEAIRCAKENDKNAYAYADAAAYAATYADAAAYAANAAAYAAYAAAYADAAAYAANAANAANAADAANAANAADAAYAADAAAYAAYTNQEYIQLKIMKKYCKEKKL